VKVAVDGQSLVVAGDRNAIVALAEERLVASGARLLAPGEGGVPNIVIVSFPLLPVEEAETGPEHEVAEAMAAAMAGRGQGRIVFLLSAIAAMPMRRHPGYAVGQAAALARMRGLAMRFAPAVLINAVGVGAIGTPLVAGDAAMIGHTAVGRAGTALEVAETVLFLCDPANTYLTGQMLSVDGGWSAGYGRNF
jgi:NAD(P)-dependent dehydrogenase (short-subunit alcohol dehydrogenase family)